MEKARKELGDNTWTTATGTIAGVALGALVLVLIYGFDDFDENAGIGFLIILAIFGTSGFFFGRKVEGNYYQKVLARARQLEEQE